MSTTKTTAGTKSASGAQEKILTALRELDKASAQQISEHARLAYSTTTAKLRSLETAERAAYPHNQVLQLVNDLLTGALAEAARAERALRRRLRDLNRALHAEQNLPDQGRTPPGCPPTTPASASRNGSGWPPRSTRSAC